MSGQRRSTTRAGDAVQRFPHRRVHLRRPRNARRHRRRRRPHRQRQPGNGLLRPARRPRRHLRRAPHPRPGTARHIRDAYDGLGELVRSALDRCPPTEEIYYDQVAQIHLPTWHTRRTVLVGDAAYAVSLLAGQGASLGIAGAYVLADQLAGKPTIDAALTAYEQQWRPIAEEKQQVGRAAARWFLPTSRTQIRTRRAMLHVARLPFIDRLIATRLAGKPTTPLPGT